MSNFNQLMAQLNGNNGVNNNEPTSVLQFLDDVVNAVVEETKKAYAEAVIDVSNVAAHVEMNVRATPALARKGFNAGREDAARYLLEILNK